MAAPVHPGTRGLVVAGIRGGMGCNEIARELNISPGTVSGIARREGLHFGNEWRTATAAQVRRARCTLARAERESQLLDEYLALPQTTRQRDGRETRRARKIDRALNNLHRHHNRY